LLSVAAIDDWMRELAGLSYMTMHLSNLISAPAPPPSYLPPVILWLRY
jgi:hypothetical protein